MKSTTHDPVSSAMTASVVLRRSYTDFDRLSEDARGFGLDWLQLDRGNLNATVQQVCLSESLLTRFRFNRSFHQQGTAPAGMWTFAVIGSRSPPVGWGRDDATRNHIVLFARDQGYRFVSRPGFHGDTITVSENAIHLVAEVTGQLDPIADLPKGQAILEADAELVGALRHRLNAIHSRAGGDSVELLAGDAQFELLSTLVAALSSDRDRSLRSPDLIKRATAFRRAIEFINHNAHRKPSIVDVCSASGASLRTLNYSFRERLGVTPKQYLQARRLWSVRRELCRADPGVSISEIAARWGFWHMGRFAAQYRSQFGELPSETRCRRMFWEPDQ